MELNRKTVGEVAVLEISGRLDSGASKELEDALMELIGGGTAKLLLDFAGVDYINSSGLRVLLMALQQLKKTGGKLHLCDIRDYMREVFEISGYTEIFPIFQTQTEAMSAFS